MVNVAIERFFIYFDIKIIVKNLFFDARKVIEEKGFLNFYRKLKSKKYLNYIASSFCFISENKNVNK